MKKFLILLLLLPFGLGTHAVPLGVLGNQVTLTITGLTPDAQPATVIVQNGSTPEWTFLLYNGAVEIGFLEVNMEETSPSEGGTVTFEFFGYNGPASSYTFDNNVTATFTDADGDILDFTLFGPDSGVGSGVTPGVAQSDFNIDNADTMTLDLSNQNFFKDGALIGAVFRAPEPSTLLLMSLMMLSIRRLRRLQHLK